MANKLPNPKQVLTEARERWKASQFPPVMREAEANLSGRFFRRRTGAMLRNVQEKSGLIPKGFRLATTSPALIAWTKGSPRKRFWVAPVRARALSWIGRDGNRRFSRGHWIPAWRFSPRRPALEDAMNRRRPRFQIAWQREMAAAMKQIAPPVRISVAVKT